MHDTNRLDHERAVEARYSEGAKDRQAALCCATGIDPSLLAAIPKEVVERDYGCGDPTRHVRAGEVVLDLGSGTGKACFVASQVVGPTGRVVGVDLNDDMLALARGAAPEVARRIGYSNVEFRKARIHDLRLDRDLLDAWLKEHPVRGEADARALEAKAEEFRRERPLVPDDSVDVVISNCVLNLVKPEDKAAMFGEIFRVLKRGGRAVISDVTSDEDVPEDMQRDPELWSGCISGAFREDLFLEAFEGAGFHGVTVLERQASPWQTVNGIEFRSMTVAAWKGKEGACWDQGHAVVYRGPFRQVEDDDGHVLRRGVRTAVCEKTFRILSRAPYREHVEPIEPRVLVPLEQAPPFACTGKPRVREARETKGAGYAATTDASSCCTAAGGADDKGCC